MVCSGAHPKAQGELPVNPDSRLALAKPEEAYYGDPGEGRIRLQMN